jgi:hypothetical protein
MSSSCAFLDALFFPNVRVKPSGADVLLDSGVRQGSMRIGFTGSCEGDDRATEMGVVPVALGLVCSTMRLFL